MGKNRGFSLVEMMVVLVLIALLSIAATVSIARFVEKAKIAQLLADQKTFQEASISYSSDVGAWPPDVYPQEDPGFLAWNQFIHRCGGQDDIDQPYGGPQCQQITGSTSTSSCNTPYINLIQKHWNGPYLETMPSKTPWGGSYDYEFWGQGNAGWGVPQHGIYLTVRPKYNPEPENGGVSTSSYCNYFNGDSDPNTSVPADYEIKLQQMGLDVDQSAGVNVADHHVTVVVHRF